MALQTATAYIAGRDYVPSQTPLFDQDSLRPSLEHEERKMLRDAEEDEG